MRDLQTGRAVAAASHALRSASIGALPSSTLRSITDAAAALSEVPSIQTLALASIQPNVAMMHTAGLAAKVGAQYDVPVIARLAELAQQPSGIDIMKAAGIASSLDAALATFRPQRVIFDAINAAGLSRPNATFAAQAAQILSSQE